MLVLGRHMVGPFLGCLERAGTHFLAGATTPGLPYKHELFTKTGIGQVKKMMDTNLGCTVHA